jgi:hypothetical protein
MPTTDLGRQWQLRVRVDPEQRTAVIALAKRRHLSLTQLVRNLLSRELRQSESQSGPRPDESAIREMAILVAVELVLKLQEANTPGGPSLSRRLLEDAARAAIARIEMVETSLRKIG